jgi:hypothetical protein
VTTCSDDFQRSFPLPLANNITQINRCFIRIFSFWKGVSQGMSTFEKSADFLEIGGDKAVTAAD